MKPTVGRVVHYVSYGTPGGEYASQCRAAIVTEVSSWVNSGTDQHDVGLCVLNPTGIFFRSLAVAGGGCRYDTGYGGGTWHWPERAEETS